MSPMKALLAVPALALALTAVAPDDANARAKRSKTPPPPSTYEGQWFTTPDGCSYSRAKAPGYATMWILILNPHHIGQPPAGKHCATMLTSRT